MDTLGLCAAFNARCPSLIIKPVTLNLCFCFFPFHVAFLLAFNTLKQSTDGKEGLKWVHLQPLVYQCTCCTVMSD